MGGEGPGAGPSRVALSQSLSAPEPLLLHSQNGIILALQGGMRARYIYIYICCAMLSPFSHVHLLVTPWTIAHQAPLFMGFSRQEYWTGLPCPPPGDLPDPRIEPKSLMSPALAAQFFTTSAT